MDLRSSRSIGRYALVALGAAVISLLVTVPGALAHDGHTHTVKGTVTAVDQKHVEIKTPSGEVLSIALNEKTTYVRAKKKIDPVELKVGKRVVIGIGNGEDPLIAGEIQIGAVSAAPAHSAHKEPHK
jgi:small-conductance mechanosensitive channel